MNGNYDWKVTPQKYITFYLQRLYNFVMIYLKIVLFNNVHVYKT